MYEVGKKEGGRRDVCDAARCGVAKGRQNNSTEVRRQGTFPHRESFLGEFDHPS